MWGAGDRFGSLFTNAAESMDSYHGNREAGTKNIFYTTSLIPPPTFSLPTGAFFPTYTTVKSVLKAGCMCGGNHVTPDEKPGGEEMKLLPAPRSRGGNMNII